MGTSKRPGGLYYVNGSAVDANGNAIPDAPPKPADTVVAAPGSAPASSLAQEIATGVATALKDALGGPATPSAKPESKKDDKNTGGAK